MPIKPIDYSKTEIYKLIHKDDIDNENIYIGSTTNFKTRKHCHKKCCKNKNQQNYNLKVYQNIRNNGGWEEWNMLLIENFPCTKKTEADVRERFWIDFYKSKLNTYIPGRTNDEWRNDHKDELFEKAKIYNQDHKEEISEQRKKYNKKNKEKISEYWKEYRNDHKKELVEKGKKSMKKIK